MCPFGGYFVANNPLRYVDPSGHTPNCVDYDESGTVCLLWEDTWEPSPSLVNFEGDGWTAVQKNEFNTAAWSAAYGYYRVVQTEKAATPAYSHFHIAGQSQLHSSEELSPRELFDKINGGPVTFVIKPQCGNERATGCSYGVDQGAWAWSRIGELGEVWVNEEALKPGSSYTGLAIRQNVVHELMHGLDQRGGGAAHKHLAAASATNPLLTRTQGGFAGPFVGWQQSRPADANSPEELFADMGLGWTYSQWQANPQAVDYKAGVAKAQYMEANMSWMIALAVANN